MDVTDALKDLSLDQAYAAQAELILSIDRQISGWKIGATSFDSQKRLGLKDPFFGPVFEEDIFKSDEQVPLFQTQKNSVETEICLRINSDFQIPELNHPHRSMQALDLSVGLAFEIVCPRFEGGMQNAGRMAITDGGINHAVILGEFIDWQLFDPQKFEVKLEKNGSKASNGDFNSQIWQHHRDPLSWLAQRPELQGKQLKAGCIIMTGTMTGVIPIDIGDKVIAQSPDLGVVRATFKKA